MNVRRQYELPVGKAWKLINYLFHYFWLFLQLHSLVAVCCHDVFVLNEHQYEQPPHPINYKVLFCSKFLI